MRSVLIVLALAAPMVSQAATRIADLQPIVGAWKIIPAPGVLPLHSPRFLTITPERIGIAGNVHSIRSAASHGNRFAIRDDSGRLFVFQLKAPDRMCGRGLPFADGRSATREELAPPFCFERMKLS